MTWIITNTEATIREVSLIHEIMLEEEHEQRIWQRLRRRWATKHDDEYRNVCSILVQGIEAEMLVIDEMSTVKK